MNIDVLKQVAMLPGMSSEELKATWRKLCQSEPPPYNRTMLVTRLAYRIQELAHGGLSAQTEKRMFRMATDDPPQEKRKLPGDKFLPGMRLVREWKGVEHCCTALADGGFEYLGRRFGSLSAVANAITGTKWNGNVFFGIKKQGEKQ
ncbi:MAG: DUF2924 domain-containing protein [Magnetococcales bacterium]|nr:DUF2924 domain-containing protein [Magnetococcales bacterium]MBF0098505.1 DUF2924 domain-containing protein [Magnetococcales bacterium]MBF0116402.1 DUF2924 domain-containing protein [Magnetococcales bacterium]MBF0117000.1 DUF2924 domain-containing protein [Magnetococcales bacterium]